MTMAALVWVLRAVEAILFEYGHADTAAWMSERTAILGSPASSEAEIRQAREELHSMVMGVGGLVDLPLEPAGSRDTAAARHALDNLADRLKVLTR